MSIAKFLLGEEKEIILRRKLYSYLVKYKIPILFGKLAGKKWLLGSSGKVFRFITTTYEKELTEQLIANVKPGEVVYDIGAHVGYFTLLSSVLVGKNGKVFAFEPAPRNVSILKEHVRINNMDNVVVTDAAVSDYVGEAFFDLGEGSWGGKISSNGSCPVKITSLNHLFEVEKLPLPDHIKIDVEGEECKLLQGCEGFLRNHSPKIYLSIHNDNYPICWDYLRKLGYSISHAKDINSWYCSKP